MLISKVTFIDMYVDEEISFHKFDYQSQTSKLYLIFAWKIMWLCSKKLQSSLVDTAVTISRFCGIAESYF